jgi:hypothetical protein
LAFLLSFLRARSLRFFFLLLFLNGIFPHCIQRRNTKKVYVLPITIANYKYENDKNTAMTSSKP